MNSAANKNLTKAQAAYIELVRAYLRGEGFDRKIATQHATRDACIAKGVLIVTETQVSKCSFTTTYTIVD